MYPTCQEPCAGSCSSDGHCEATTTYTSPIVIALVGNHFALSGLQDPVFFDMDDDGELRAMAWTAREGGTAFLALDLDGNGVIDNGAELFGDRTRMPDGSRAANGYVALAQYDAPVLGGNSNLEIDPGDAIWSLLCLWFDENHNGLTDPGELMSLTSQGIRSIGLDYRLDRRVDAFGNHFWLRGSATREEGNGVEHPIVIYDVFFLRE